MKELKEFFRHRLRSCFLRRRQYAIGSEDRAHAVIEARSFLRYYRAELALERVDQSQTPSQKHIAGPCFRSH